MPGPQPIKPRDFASPEERPKILKQFVGHPRLLCACLDGNCFFYCEKHGVIAVVNKAKPYSYRWILALRTRSVVGVENWRFRIEEHEAPLFGDYCWAEPQCVSRSVDDIPTYVLKRIVYELNLDNSPEGEQ